MRNTLVIYREVGNNLPKGKLMPNVDDIGQPESSKAGDRKAWRFMMSLRPIS